MKQDTMTPGMPEAFMRNAWLNMKKAYSQTAESVLGHRQRKSKTDIRWSKIDVRRK